MLRGAWLYVIAAGLVALGLSTVRAGERVAVNDSVLDCVPEGCFVVRYVPAPRLKAKIQGDANGAEVDQQAEPTNEKPKPTPSTEPPISNIVFSDVVAVPLGSDKKETEPNANEKPRQFLGLYPNEWVSVFTFVLTISTVALWLSASRQTQVMADTLTQMKHSDAARAKEFTDQLKVAKDSATSATTAAEAVDRQALTMEESLRVTRASQHPYLFLESVSQDIEAWHLNKSFFSWSFRFKNEGTTPAIIQSITAGLGLSEGIPSLDGKAFGVPGFMQDVRFEEEMEIIGGWIPARQESRLLERGFIPRVMVREGNIASQMAKVRVATGELSPYLMGSVIYNDIYRGQHTLRFCMKVTFGLQKPTFEGGNDYNSHSYTAAE